MIVHIRTIKRRGNDSIKNGRRSKEEVMRKAFPIAYGFLAMFCILGINCVEAKAPIDTTLEGAHQLTEKNKAILSEFMEEVWNKGNLDAADKFISTPYLIHSDPGDPWDGQSLDLST